MRRGRLRRNGCPDRHSGRARHRRAAHRRERVQAARGARPRRSQHRRVVSRWSGDRLRTTRPQYSFLTLAWWWIALPIFNFFALFAYYGAALFMRIAAGDRADTKEKSGGLSRAESRDSVWDEARQAAARTSGPGPIDALLDEYVGDVFSYVNSAGSAFYRDAGEAPIPAAVYEHSSVFLCVLARGLCGTDVPFVRTAREVWRDRPRAAGRHELIRPDGSDTALSDLTRPAPVSTGANVGVHSECHVTGVRRDDRARISDCAEGACRQSASAALDCGGLTWA